MNWKKISICFIFAALVLAQDTMQDARKAQPPMIGSVPNQERGPSFSSPQEKMAPNGDRVSPYPPYYHPEHSGR